VIDGVIFDLDGTLWDTRAVCARAWNKVIRASGLALPDVTAARLTGIMGLEPHEIAERMFPGLVDETRNRLIRACYDREVDDLRTTSPEDVLYPGVAAGLAVLKDRLRLCVVSNCQTGYLDAFLTHSGVGEMIADGECIGTTGQPKADNLRLVVTRQRLRSPLYVGDTERDESAASEAGIAFVHARYGFGNTRGKPPAVDSFDELVQLILTRIRAASN